MNISIDPGILSLIIFALMIVFWVMDRVPIALIAMAGCIACVIFGIVPFSTAMSGFTNDIIFLVAGMDILAQAVFKVGLASFIGRTVSRFAKGSEKRLMIISFFASALISAFIMNITTIMIFLVIFRCLAKESTKYNLKNLVLPMIVGVDVGGVLTLIGSTPQLAGQSIIESFQGLQGFTMFQFTPIAVVLVIACGLFVYFYSYKANLQTVAGDEAPGDSQAPDLLDNNPYGVNICEPPKKTRKEKIKTIILVGIVVMLLALMVSGIVSLGVAAMLAAILSILTGCISQKEAFKNLNWNIVIWLAGCFSIAAILEHTGGTDIMTAAAVAIIPQAISPFLFFALVLLVVMVVAQFVSDTACVLIFMPVFLSMSQALGISHYPIAIAIIFGASLSYMTPLASGQIALALTVGHNFREIFRFGWPLHVLTYIVMLIVVPLFFPL